MSDENFCGSVMLKAQSLQIAELVTVIVCVEW